MKKIWIGSFFIIAVSSCSGNSSENETLEGSNTNSPGLTNPVAIDTTIHPSGMSNSNVISTDTAAMNTSNAYKKLDSAKKKNK